MEEKRRSFLKKAAVVGAVSAVGTVAATAATKSSTYSSNGVVVGHSDKKEILYKKTEAWDEYYRTAL
ncbi:twin-arginine translocation signal domain-containing protein [Sulfurospirillum sp. 1612]|uniref:twin-arginine translocation signal domain-containing protein n=1 Tax=Sulfurospirillum sp. 1612 TaxID=3094835 RepID=UPI002F9227C0